MSPSRHNRFELQEISPMLAADNSTGRPFAVPAGYFEGFPDRMLVLAKTLGGAAVAGQQGKTADVAEETAALSPLLAGLSKKMPFEVPAGYFEHAAIPVPGLLDRLEKINPYAVPAGYFARFPELMLQRVQPKTGGAKVISLGRSWMRYAAAAVVAAVIAVGGWMYVQRDRAITPAAAGNDVALQLQQDLNQLSDDAILDFNNEATTAEVPANSLAALDNDDLNAADIHFLLEDVSDKALQDFLNLEQPNKDELLQN